MGTRTASTKVNLTFTSTIINTLENADAAQATVQGTILSGTLANGVSANQGNRAMRTTSNTISSGVSEDIDLYDFASVDFGAGSGKDALGQALTLEEIVTLVIKQSSGAGRLEIMPTNPTNYVTWVPSLTAANGGALKSGGVLMMHQPATDAFDIQDGASHVLRLAANGGDVSYDLYILGRHDDDESSSSSSESSSSSSSSSLSSLSSSSSSTASSSSSSSSSTSVSSSSSTTT